MLPLTNNLLFHNIIEQKIQYSLSKPALPTSEDGFQLALDIILQKEINLIDD